MDSFHFLGNIITQDLKRVLNINYLITKAHQQIYFLSQLKKFNLPKTVMVQLHIHTHLLHHQWVRCCHCQGQEIGYNLPPLPVYHTSMTLKWAVKIVADPVTLDTIFSRDTPSSRSMKTKTSHHKSFLSTHNWPHQQYLVPTMFSYPPPWTLTYNLTLLFHMCYINTHNSDCYSAPAP